jgi:penicillin-binding protein 1A
MLPAPMRARGYDGRAMNARRRPLALGLIVVALASSACHLPKLKEEQAKAPVLPQTSFVFAADGSKITALHAEQNRVIVPLSRIPENIRHAVVAIEDKRFYDHIGIDVKALMRAAYIDATTGRIVEGGSTITQQYVKNAYTGDDQTLSRKLREAVLAYELEKTLTKDQILAKYLNTVYFGNGAYGIQAAAQTYFGEPAQKLGLAQAALLAGLIAAPSTYDPVARPDLAVTRRNLVLEQMRELGMIDAPTYTNAIRRRLSLHLHQSAQHYPAPYFVDYLKQWFLSNPRFGKTVQARYNLLFEGGLRIQTTIVPRLQTLAERAVSSILIYRSDPYAAMTVIDPRTGYIKAMVGGRNYWNPRDRFAKVNLATGGSTGRQAGSAFKPFTLVAALEHGISPSQTFNGSSVAIPLSDGTVWTPGNAEGSAYGYISLEDATINSVNVAYVNIEKAVGGGNIYLGARRVVETAKRMGIRCCTRTTSPKTPLQAVPSAVIGTNEVNTLEMASAYGTLADGGAHVAPTPVESVTTPDGRVLYQANPQPRQVVNPAVVTVADGILQKVVLYGTGVAANIGRPQIGKTGTAQNYSDAWFVGAVPQLVTAVWVGFPQGQIPMSYPTVRISHVYGGTWPAEIWHTFMINATKALHPRPFPFSSVRYATLRIDVTQGCLANRYTPPQDIDSQTFIAGTEPRLKVCKQPTSYQMLTVPSVIGLKESSATDLLRSSGFQASVQYQPSAERPGTVIAQDPAAGQRALQTSTVTITVSQKVEKVAVPSVIGMTRSAATATLRDAGFRVVVQRQQQCDPADPSCVYQQGVVWAQSPSAGAKVPKGSGVTIVVNP